MRKNLLKHLTKQVIVCILSSGGENNYNKGFKMLIGFEIENWMSYKGKTEFSMIASRERQHGERVPKIPKFQSRILPIASIYGGNASGKTNFFKAIDFVKDFVVEGTKPDSMILCEPFRLDNESADKPTSFKTVMLIDEVIYDYSFSVTRKAVINERLVQITSTNEKVLYDRKDGNPNFHKSLKRDGLLKFAFMGTRPNQLFLTNSVSQSVDTFRNVYDWFKNTLVLIAPDARFGRYESFFDDSDPLFKKMNTILSQLDTGIASLKYINVPFDSIPIPEQIKIKLKEDISDKTVAKLHSPDTSERYIVMRVDGELIAKKLVAYHKNKSGSDEKFEFQQESDGSLRVIDLLPSFIRLSEFNSNRVIIVDELNRSLHTQLTKQLIRCYLANCDEKYRSQLLFTTHDLLLMDQQLLRRDEMWAADRDEEGISSLRAFIEFKEIRYDKDIMKSYLQGRLGGIPKITLKKDKVLNDRKC